MRTPKKLTALLLALTLLFACAACGSACVTAVLAFSVSCACVSHGPPKKANCCAASWSC